MARLKAKNRNKARLTEDEQILSCSNLPGLTPLQSDSWRVFRIMGEFVEGFESFANVGEAVTIFGSARVAPEEPIYQSTVEVASLLGKAGFSIITGGGPGLMEAANKGARDSGAYSYGLNIQLAFEQHLNPYADESMEFRYFFVRKTMFVKYAQAFVIMPGGLGTLDELFEALTLIQTGKIHNFPVVLFDSDYWRGLLDWMRDTLLKNKRISKSDLDLIYLADTPQEVLDYINKCAQDERVRTTHECASLKDVCNALRPKA